jgi:mono/diheme cytochrome c family protein
LPHQAEKGIMELVKMINSIISFFYTMINQLGFHHPLHATQIHIPIGLIFGAFILSVTAKLRRNSMMSKAAWYCVIIAMIWIPPTVITGLMDWKHYYAGVWIFPFHMKFMLAGVLTILLPVGVFIGLRRQTVSNGMITVNTLCLLTVVGLGFFGGELVYGNKSAPVASENIQRETYQPGQELYAANCGGCHANGGNVINLERPVKSSPKLSDFPTFLYWVRNPKTPMPGYPNDVLSDQQTNDIYQYIIHVLNKS